MWIALRQHVPLRTGVQNPQHRFKNLARRNGDCDIDDARNSREALLYDMLKRIERESIRAKLFRPAFELVAQSSTVGCTWTGDPTTRSCLRFYDINPGANSILQQLTFGNPGLHYYYPAITANAAGDATIVYL
jgi:hypothetical protein